MIDGEVHLALDDKSNNHVKMDINRYGSSTQLVFSGIGNVHAVNDAFEELRNALDPLKMESRLDRWKGDAERWKGDTSGSILERTVS